MPFVVPPQNQPQPAQPQPQQPRPQGQQGQQGQQGRGGMNMQSMSPFQNRIGMQGGGQPLPRYGGGQRPQYGGGPLSIMPPQRQQQFNGYGGQRPQYGPMSPMMRNPYQQHGGGRPMPWGYDSGDAYTKDMRFNSTPPPPQFSNRPQQGNYVGEGVYADGTPMPPPQQPGVPTNQAALSLIQSNGAPQGGVYGGGFSAPMPTPGTSPVQRPYGRGGRGGGNGSTY